MQALVWHGGRNLAVEELPEPEPGEDEVVLDVGLAGICGSDLHPFKGHHGPRRPPLVLGHEVVGTVPDLPGRWSVFPLTVCGRSSTVVAAGRTCVSNASCWACIAPEYSPTA